MLSNFQRIGKDINSTCITHLYLVALDAAIRRVFSNYKRGVMSSGIEKLKLFSCNNQFPLLLRPDHGQLRNPGHVSVRPHNLELVPRFVVKHERIETWAIGDTFNSPSPVFASVMT